MLIFSGKFDEGGNKSSEKSFQRPNKCKSHGALQFKTTQLPKDKPGNCNLNSI